jgi:selenocysteine lyase/cysteine desulfurase
MSHHPSVADFRAQFPALADTVHLASCSQGALSEALAAAMLEFQHTIRAHGAPWDLWMEKVAAARSGFARLIGADDDEVAVVSCASEGAFQVASTRNWADRPGIVTTDMEFPSIAQVWLAQEPRGARVAHVPDRDGVVELEDYAALIDERVGLVSVPLISYRNGLRLPVREVIALARRHGAKTVVDAYQGAGVEPIDVRELGCDYLVSGALKYMLGIPGIAFLYARDGVVDELPPSMTGWFGREDPFLFDPRHLDHPVHARRFEAGTPSIPSAYGAVAGMRMLGQLDLHRVREHVTELTRSLQDQLAAAGEVTRSPKDDALRGPQVALYDVDPHALDAFLKSRSIIGSPRGEVVRLSFHFYNDQTDVDRVVRAIADYRTTH